MKGLVKLLGILTVVVGVCSVGFAGPVLDDFSSLSKFGWAIQATGGNGSPSATLISDGNMAIYTLTITQSLGANDSAYSYADATLWMGWVPTYTDYAGFVVDVADKSEGLIWNFGPVNTQVDSVPQYEAYGSFAWGNGGFGASNANTATRLVISVVGPAVPGAYSIRFDSLRVVNDVDANAADINAIYGLLDSDADGDLTDETLGMTAAQQSTLNALNTAVNGVGGIIDRLEAIEEALSKPGASGDARWGK